MQTCKTLCDMNPRHGAPAAGGLLLLLLLQWRLMVLSVRAVMVIWWWHVDASSECGGFGGKRNSTGMQPKIQHATRFIL